MTESERLATLNSTEFLTDVPEELLIRVNEQLEEEVREPGDVLFREGDRGRDAYIVVEGRVRLEAGGVPLVERAEGDLVGEFALVDLGPRSASATCVGEVVLLKWSRDSFQSLMATHWEIARGILRGLLQKLREEVAAQVETALERQRLQQDLARAREIQMGMLPGAELTTETLEVCGYCRPAAAVGGDYYDYLEIAEGQLALIIADVMGHGFYSGLLVAMAKSYLVTQATKDRTPAKIMQSLNRVVSLSIEDSLLMSCCSATIDVSRGRVTYCNAGHNAPLHYMQERGAIEMLAPTDPILGVPGLPTDYHQQTRPWKQGDVLLFYSDGITEAESPRGEMFGERRLEEALIVNVRRPAASIRDRVLEVVREHREQDDFNDDVTLLVARYPATVNPADAPGPRSTGSGGRNP